ncbi:MAG: efflux RND transporter periplasmic adaptor subunit [Chloroflexota bacterium]|nr:efflux RND transporter periplasmic adaptor subunit [Chloroflexota bacterium]
MPQQKNSIESAQNTQKPTNQMLTLPGFSNDLSMQDDLEPRSRRRRWIIGISVVLLLVIVGALGFSLLNKKAPVSYQHQAVTQGDIALTISATGPLQSPATYNLVAGTSATITEIDVKVGQTVKKGQTLAKLDKTALQDAVNQAQATVNADQDTLYNTQVAAGWVNTPAVIQARDTLQIAQTQLDAANHNLNNATLKAPHAGTVTVINGTVGGSPGASANASSSGTSTSGSAFIQIVDLSSLQVTANVNEADTANLKVGDSVVFTVNAYGDRPFKGSVAAISASGTTTSNVVTYPVTINVDQQSIQNANLLPGMTASITITVVQHHNVLLIPVDAINFARLASDPQATGGSPQLISQQDATTAVNQARQMLTTMQSQNPDLAALSPIPAFVIEQRGPNTYVARPVVLGITDGTSYEVLQGLSAQEAIVTGTGNGGSPNPAPGGNGGGSKG